MFDNINDPALSRRIKQHIIGREHVFFAVVQPGFEHTAARELAGFGLNISDEFIEGGVEFSGRLDDCYAACIRSRTASRIVMRVAEFLSHSFYELERSVRSFPWELYISPEYPVKFSISAKKSMIYHTGKLREIFTKEMGDSFTFSEGTDDGSVLQQTVLLRNFRDRCAVSIDASGAFLYKRGSRKLIGKAPIRETLASNILLEAGVNDYDLLLDPMCGSGVFSIEAASIFTDTCLNVDRNFSFKIWPSFKEKNYQYLKNRIISFKKPAENTGKTIICSDIDPEEVKVAESNIPEEFRSLIKPYVQDFFSFNPDMISGKKTLIVMNPPYGKRIQEENINSLYREIGRKLKSDFNNSGYAVIVAGTDAEKELNLEFDRKIDFMNGGIKAAVLFRDI